MASTVRDRRRDQDQADDNDTSQDHEGSDQAESKKAGRPKAKSGAARVKSAHIITEHIDVGVPAQVAFDQWTQYDKWSEMFKKESADTGRRNRHGAKGGGSQGEVKVRAKIGPSERQFSAQVVEVEPGRRISWKSKGQVQAMGTTSFHRLDDRLTRVMVQIEYRPTGFLEVVGNFFRMQRRRVRRDLRLFKHYIEMRGKPTGKGPRQASGDGLTAEVDKEEKS
jgi:uncharacterized membrane protein